MRFLDFPTRRNVAISASRNAIDNVTIISTPDQVNKLLDFISPLIKGDDKQDDKQIDPDDFREEQNLVASLVHLFDNPDPDVVFQLYVTARSHFAPDDTCKKERVQHTLVPLVFRCFPLVNRILGPVDSGEPSQDTQRKARKVFKFVLDTVAFLAGKQLPELALRLFLQAAQAANHANLETVVYEFITRAFMIYEEEISDSRAQFAAIELLVGTVQTISCLGDENYDTIVTKCAQFSAKLYKKPDQCRAVAKCSHLFWKEGYFEGKRVLECLQRSLKIADFACTDSSANIDLFVEILDEYLYYFSIKNQNIVATFLNSLIALINTKMNNLSPADLEREESPFYAHYKNTLAYIKSKKSTDPDFEAIDV